jgi:hypothetical protein
MFFKITSFFCHIVADRPQTVAAPTGITLLLCQSVIKHSRNLGIMSPAYETQRGFHRINSPKRPISTPRRRKKIARTRLLLYDSSKCHANITGNVELAAAVDAYLDMLQSEKNQQPFIKAQINRSLREPGAPLEGRTRASVEYRMQNISAVLVSEKLPTVKGYVPAANVGNNSHARILRIIKERRKIK